MYRSQLILHNVHIHDSSENLLYELYKLSNLPCKLHFFILTVFCVYSIYTTSINQLELYEYTYIYIHDNINCIYNSIFMAIYLHTYVYTLLINFNYEFPL